MALSEISLSTINLSSFCSAFDAFDAKALVLLPLFFESEFKMPPPSFITESYNELLPDI